jgi:hypothetical protein
VTVAVAIAVSFLPLVGIVLKNLGEHAATGGSHKGLKAMVAMVGYPTFSVFGSVAIAPWFLPLSIPVVIAALLLIVSIWFSSGRRWFIYFILAMILLALSGHLDVKRVLFLTSWFFLAMGLAAFSETSRYPRLAMAAIAVLVTVGWIGIFSGRHYATSNLYEPWGQVARVVASDTERSATVISENTQFFFYLDYQLGLGSDTGASEGSYLGEELYRAHGFTVLKPFDDKPLPTKFHGKVVVVNGEGLKADMESVKAVNEQLQQQCMTLGEYKAAPDPAAALKRKLATHALVRVLDYRTDVTWYACPAEGS